MGNRHYLSGTTEYRMWVNLRAFHKNDLCDEWKESPIEFVSYVRRLADCASKGYTLDRIREDGMYEPGNVHFVKRSHRNATRNFGKLIGIRRRGKRFVARIIVNKREHTIGSADTKQKAVKLRNDYIIQNKLPHRLQ